MAPTIVLIRHAQALHNIDNKSHPLSRRSPNHSLPDPELSELGRTSQCTELRKSLGKRFHDLTDVAIIVSPMRRTIETAQLSLSWLINKGVRLEADARWQENSAKPCDTGSPIEALREEFPTVDFSNVDPVYPDKTSPAGARYAYNRKAILARGRSALASLASRPEKVIFVVSHSGFLRAGLTGYWWFNADYRIFDLDEAVAGTGDPAGLKQWESTLAGGLGWSRTYTVPLGDALPEEDVVDPPDV